jgi:hypothetical protein
LVTATGSAVYAAALRLLKQVFDVAAEKQVNKILVNTLGVEGPADFVGCIKKEPFPANTVNAYASNPCDDRKRGRPGMIPLE